MKVSNKILWVSLACLFGCVVALLIFIRVSTAPLMEKIEPQSQMTGSTQIKGDGIQIYYLTIKGSGSIDVDFMGSPVNFAELDLSGSSKIQMTMAGGDLTGKISGSGMVIYDGEVRHQEVKISGSGSIQRRKSTV